MLRGIGHVALRAYLLIAFVVLPYSSPWPSSRTHLRRLTGIVMRQVIAPMEIRGVR